jgi:hypothetical protein
MTSQSPDITQSPARRVGYAVSVIVNVIMWVLVNDRPGWRDLPFLTEDFRDILWIVNLSIITGAMVNIAFLFYDPAWFKSLGQVGVMSVGLAASIQMWQVFPFDFSSYTFPWEGITKVLLVLGILGSVVAIIVELVKLAKLAGRQPPASARSQSLHRQ